MRPRELRLPWRMASGSWQPKCALKRELKVLEIVKREAIEFSISQGEESIRLYLMKYHWEVS